jgi:CHASE2 domain-containing sensor protein
MKKLLSIMCLVVAFGCVHDEESFITIVDIGHLDRGGLAKELVIINKYSPKVIGLDFLLTTDSLDKDIALVRAISEAGNLIQASRLHNNDPNEITRWDSLQLYHPKFRAGKHGYSNFTADDSVIFYELPVRQYYKAETELAFSYLVASEYNSDRINPLYKDDDRDFAFARSFLRRDFKIISINDLMTGNFDKKDIAGRIVLMGNVSDTEDSYYVDEGKSERIAGVEIHASIISQILD